MSDILFDLRKVQELCGDTYSSMEVVGMVGRAADEIGRLRADRKQLLATLYHIDIGKCMALSERNFYLECANGELLAALQYYLVDDRSEKAMTAVLAAIARAEVRATGSFVSEHGEGDGYG